MKKVSIEVHYSTARFMVGVKAESIQQALKIIQARYPHSTARVEFPIDPESFFVENSAA